MQEEEEDVKYAIGRPIGGIYLNGIEYLLDDEGEHVRIFHDKNKCLSFIHENLGVSGDDAEDYVFEYDMTKNESKCATG